MRVNEFQGMTNLLIRTFDDSDEYCPNCDNHYIIDAKIPHMVWTCPSLPDRLFLLIHERANVMVLTIIRIVGFGCGG
jgi:hypothetical protein